MNWQEKYNTTVRFVHLVAVHYRALKYGGAARRSRSGGMRKLEAWLKVIEAVVKELKRSAGKSSARARKDRLVARVIEMTVFEQAGSEKVRLYLTGPRPLNRRYVDRLTEEAVGEIMNAAAKAGLI